MNGIMEESPTPAEWRPYTNSVRATHWYELFLSNPSDERRNLTWKGVFTDVDKTINFYSSMDEVVANLVLFYDRLTLSFGWMRGGVTGDRRLSGRDKRAPPVRIYGIIDGRKEHQR